MVKKTVKTKKFFRIYGFLSNAMTKDCFKRLHKEIFFCLLPAKKLWGAWIFFAYRRKFYFIAFVRLRASHVPAHNAHTREERGESLWLGYQSKK